MIRHFLTIEPKSGESKDITGIDVTFNNSSGDLLTFKIYYAVRVTFELPDIDSIRQIDEQAIAKAKEIFVELATYCQKVLNGEQS